MNRLKAVAHICALSLLAFSAHAARGGYQLIELGDALATGINDVGQVVGTISVDMTDTSGAWPGLVVKVPQAAIYEKGQWHALPVPGYPFEYGTSWNDSYGRAINNQGVVYGITQWRGTTCGSHSCTQIPFSFRSGDLHLYTNVQGAVPEDNYALVRSNEQGNMALGSDKVLINGQLVLAPGVDKFSRTAIYGINNHDQFTGQYGPISGEDYLWSHAAVYTKGERKDIGTLGGDQAYGTALNDSGTVVGSSNLTPGDRNAVAFSYDGSSMKSLGTLGGDLSFAVDINNAGDIIGRSSVQGSALFHAFLYRQGQMMDLNAVLDPIFATQWTLTDAISINEAGWILAQATRNDGGEHRSVVLVPVPEAEVYAMFLSGIGVLLQMKRGRRAGKARCRHGEGNLRAYR